MLEHLGAYTIDADTLAHRAIARGAPGYQQVVETFGKWILDSKGEIDRERLGRLVFADPEALAKLEAIVHPLVFQAIDMMVRRASQPIVVIEAIKLLETDLHRACDAIWVIHAPEEVQVERLMQKRQMSRADALQRIRAQPPQAEKIAQAHVAIQNTGSYEQLWKEVSERWRALTSHTDTLSLPPQSAAQPGEWTLVRGRPREAAQIAEALTRLSQGRHTMTADDVMAAFGDKAFVLLKQGERIVGIAGWQVENLVARATDVYLESGVDLEKGLQALLNEIERASRELQCEASLVFVRPSLAQNLQIWKRLGYEPRLPETLGIQAWEEAARESRPSEPHVMFFKQLRQDRVLRPI
uniref:Dephospho-CoA kinase n=1 Tax=uncultured Chloroflexota bacterium TaxID=166587 RepID=H5SET1_9CHLR|nr:dephospho-CoA kinase [uncultured Chloroflexota bacterium]BAL56878.1 dephospho-CoA kinase [uncultured Chloroflexota bacterium]